VKGVHVFRHYYSVALLNFRKTPLAALANVSVLALGLTAFVATYAVTGFWSRAERHFANADRTFVISSSIQLADGTVVMRESPVTNPYAASYLRTDYPQIEAVARARPFFDDVPVAVGDRAIRLTAVAADPEFLDIFDLPFVVGDSRAALRAPRSVVLTQQTAERLFGADDPLGKTVSLANLVDATVTGVVGKIPEPSHLGASVTASMRFDMLASMDLVDLYRRAPAGGPENWFGMDGTTYVLFPVDGSLKPEKLAQELDAFVHRHMPTAQAAFGSLLVDLVPVRDMLALDASGAFLGGDRSVTAVLWMLGALVLAVACINYASLAAARASRRIHEVGVRKAIGASARDILLQHLLEAGLLTVAALSLALVAVRALAPLIRTNAGIDLDLALSLEPRSVAFFATLALSVTLLAGAYPAFVLARVRPMFALRAIRLRMGRRLLLSLLVGLQFAAASVLLTAVIVVYLQNHEVRRTGLGIAADPLLAIENRADISHVDADTLLNELARLPRVKAVTSMSTPPFESTGGGVLARSADEEAVQELMEPYRVSYDFADVFDMRLLAGRVFERERDVVTSGRDDGQPNIVVNRALVEALGFPSPEAAVGELVYVPKKFATMYGLGTTALPRQIIGVVENKPLRISGAERANDYSLGAVLPFAIVRVPRDDVAAALHDVDALWKRLAPGIAPQRRFVDEMFEQQYTTFARIADAFTAFCGFALVIAIVGLFAMSQVVAARRTHEIGVRKTLGAATAQIVFMLLRSFSLPVIVAGVAAWPIAYVAMRLYLDRFVTPIQLNAFPFVACLLAMLSIGWLAVGAQTLRAARTRPASVLRQE
jgi:putative ABC transport system permease protein